MHIGNTVWRVQRSRPMSAIRAAALSLLLFTAMSIAMPNAAHATGELTFDQCYGDHAGCVSDAGTELASMSGVAVSPDGSAVYVTGSNAVAHFAADPTSGTLSYDSCLADLSTLFCGGDGSSAKPLRSPRGVVVDPQHPTVFVAGNTLGAAVQLATLPAGALEYRGCVSDSGGACGTTERPVLNRASGVAVSPDGNALYVSAAGNNPFQGYISHFSVAPEGQIAFQGCVSSDGSSGACGSAAGTKLLVDTNGIAVSPNDASLYSASGEGVISHYTIDPLSRQFTWADCVSNNGSSGACEDVPGTGEPLAGAEQVAVSPDGRSVYATGSASETVSHFETSPSGQLKWEGCISSSSTSGCAQLLAPKELLNDPEGIAVSPDGKSVYVGSASAITSFTVGTEGQLAFQGCWTSEATAGCSDLPGDPLSFVDSIAVSPNGASVYAATGGGALVHLFRALPAPASPPGSSTTGSGGSTTGSGSQTTPGQAVSAVAIKASLLAQLAPNGRAAKIAQLASKKRYAYSFKALTAGTVTINWYVVPTGAHLAGKAKPKPVLFAGGHVAFTAAGTRTITIKLTGPGLAMLKHHHQLKLTAKGSFTRPGSAAITALKTFTLKR